MNYIKKIETKFRELLGIAVFLFILSACSKDESMQPTKTTAPLMTNTVTKNDGSAPYASMKGYEMIKINHIAYRSLLPDYQVTVLSDHNVVFEGRRNTAFIGTTMFTIDRETFDLLSNLFESSQLFNVSPASEVSTNPGVADVPMVITSYNKNGTYPIALTDYNDPYIKSNLYNVRVKAEALLKISLLVADKNGPKF